MTQLRVPSGIRSQRIFVVSRFGFTPPPWLIITIFTCPHGKLGIEKSGISAISTIFVPHVRKEGGSTRPLMRNSIMYPPSAETTLSSRCGGEMIVLELRGLISQNCLKARMRPTNRTLEDCSAYRCILALSADNGPRRALVSEGLRTAIVIKPGMDAQIVR